jgi:hypothetical protein
MDVGHALTTALLGSLSFKNFQIIQTQRNPFQSEQMIASFA